MKTSSSLNAADRCGATVSIMPHANKNAGGQCLLRTAGILTLCSMLLGCLAVHSVQAQTPATIVGAGTVYQLPLGTLHSRFLGSFGGMVYAGAEVSPRWTWLGKFEYVEFSSLNTSALMKTATLGQGTDAQKYKVPLPKLTMNFKTTSLTAEAQLNLFRGASVQSNAVFGFGFTNWVYTRGAYNDSLFVDSAATGRMIKVAGLAVPANRQEDWSGTFNLGLDVSVKIVDPVWFFVGADYKLIVGELWQTLDLDLENVAGMQFFSIRAGLRAEL
ncbi:MAG: hypothetical protein NTV54_09630 [Ignavibacteriales bacterium]|nr:hypothetical protein [Ignavibacteriales bacterium]